MPDTWGADSDFNPFAPHDIQYDIKSLYLYANNSSWVDSRMVYNPVYRTTIMVYEDQPGYTGSGESGDPQNYKATASGTVVLCNQNNSLQKGMAFPGGTPTEKFTENSCQYLNGNPITPNPSGSNSGKVEYIISDEMPSSSQNGQIVGSSVAYSGYNVPGAIIEASQAGELWLRIVDEDSNYQENHGRYKVTIKQPSSSQNPTSFISKLAKNVIDPITKQIDMISQTLFTNGSTSGVFKNIIRALLTLYVMFYGIGFLIGTQKFTHKDFLIRLVKMGVVMTLISDTGINFFNEYLFGLLKHGQTTLLNIVSNPELAQMETGELNVDSLFGFSNFVITTIFSKHFFSILAAFLLWFPIGWVCLAMILYTVVVYIFAIMEVVIMYVISYTAIGLFIALGPVFIPLMLFERTKGLFDGWISAMVSYAMQPVVMFAAILLITSFINETIYNLLTLELKSTKIFSAYIDFGKTKLDLFDIYWINPVAPTLQVLTDILIFYLFIELLKKVTTLSGDLSEYLFGGTAGTGALQEMSGNIKNGLTAAIGAPGVFDKSSKDKDDGEDKGKKKRKGVSVSEKSESSDEKEKDTKGVRVSKKL
jgi:type IV secretory pathway VirB6-like protein